MTEEEIPQEQIDQLKEKVIEQIQSQEAPQEQKDQFVQKIKDMNNDEFIAFLKEKGLIKDEQSPEQSQGQPQQGQGKCIFCSIVFGDTQSYKIAENEKAIAILELNPISKGHAIIVPKEHIESKENLPEEAGILSKVVSEKMKSALSPNEVKIKEDNIMGHEIINVLPVYNNEDFDSQKRQATQEELQKTQEQLEIKGEIKTKQQAEEEQASEETSSEEEEEINEENTWLPKRLP